MGRYGDSLDYVDSLDNSVAAARAVAGFHDYLKWYLSRRFEMPHLTEEKNQYREMLESVACLPEPSPWVQTMGVAVQGKSDYLVLPETGRLAEESDIEDC